MYRGEFGPKCEAAAAGGAGGEGGLGGRYNKLVLQLCLHTKHTIFYLDYMFA